ncbi:MAG: WG repeat-containing protein [Treponema sp.]|nr:WG repeat-containing protein [Treponema sp.]
MKKIRRLLVFFSFVIVLISCMNRQKVLNETKASEKAKAIVEKTDNTTETKEFLFSENFSDNKNYSLIRVNDYCGIIDEKLNAYFPSGCRNIYFINDYIFLSYGYYVEVRNKRFEFLDKIELKPTDLVFKIFYLYDEYYYIMQLVDDSYIYNAKNKTLKTIEYIVNSNPFNSSMSKLLPVGSYYYSIKDNKKFFENSDFEKVYPFIDGRAVVLKNDYKKALINENSDIIVDNIINCGWQFRNGLLPVITEECSGFIDINGNFVIICSLEDEFKKENPTGNPTLWCSFSEGYAYVHVDDNSWMIINDKGNIIREDIHYPTDNRIGFSCGLISVFENKKKGFLDTTGKLAIPCVFDSAEDFLNGFAAVVYEGKDAVLDKKGNIYFSEELIKGNKIPYINVNEKIE